jgi:hypothetical protein
MNERRNTLMFCAADQLLQFIRIAASYLDRTAFEVIGQPSHPLRTEIVLQVDRFDPVRPTPQYRYDCIDAMDDPTIRGYLRHR